MFMAKAVKRIALMCLMVSAAVRLCPAASGTGGPENQPTPAPEVAPPASFQIFSPTLPTRERFNFSFQLQQEGPVRLRTYDLSGRLVATLFNGRLPAGPHNIIWDCPQVSCGTYVLLLEVAGTRVRRTFSVEP